MVHNLQFETYRREVERYGPDTMHLSENVFCCHSGAILNFLALLDGDEGEQYRWQAALKAVDLILEDFQYDLHQKHNLVKTLNQDFSREFKVGAEERKKISEQYTNHKRLVSTRMSDVCDQDENFATTINFFENHTECYTHTVREILNSPSVAGNRDRLGQLMSGYLHMFLNRFFVSNQRKTELIIYEYLWKYYASELAREKNTKLYDPIRIK